MTPPTRSQMIAYSSGRAREASPANSAMAQYDEENPG